MKARILTFVAALLASVAAFGQGTILFNTRTGSVDAPIHNWDGTPAGAYGPGVFAQLYLVNTGSGAAVLTPLFPITTFRMSSPAAMPYVIQPAEPVVVPGIPAGSPATIVLRVWGSGATYETALHVTQTPPITITLGGDVPGSPPLPPALLVGLSGVTGAIPEPSISALFAAGLVALGCWRQKRAQ